MTAALSPTDKYVLTRLAGRLYGIPATLVAEMIQTPRLRPLPRMPGHVRGAFILRERSFLALDLRALFGMDSLVSELDDFNSMLDQREEDHRAWLAELEVSIREERPFTLSTDPTECAYGRWYETYEPQSVIIESHLRKFDAPHRAIHALAGTVLERAKSGDVDGALAQIEAARTGELSSLIELFAQFRTLVAESMREIVVVLAADLEGAGAAYCVDSVEGVVDRAKLEFSGSEDGEGTSGLTGLDGRGLTPALHGSDRELVLLINDEQLPGLLAA
ncbi:MAG: chemotaxis protein CheW [Planctomycetota bacterium]